MDVVLRQEGSVLKLQYLLPLRNDLSPQNTVAGSGPSLALALPSGLQDLTAVYMRGPEPMPVEIESAGRMSGLVFPATPGMNRVRIEGFIAWTDGMELEVGANVPVEGWSLLAAPEGLDVRGFGVRAKADQAIKGYTSLAADPIDAGDIVDLTLHRAGQAETTMEDLFAATEATDATAEDTQEDSGGGPNYLPLILLGVLLIVILAAAFRKRG